MAASFGASAPGPLPWGEEEYVASCDVPPGNSLIEEAPHPLTKAAANAAAKALDRLIISIQLLFCRSRHGGGQYTGCFVQQDALRPRDRQMPGFGRSKELLRALPAFQQVRWTRSHVVGVCRQNLYVPLFQHALGPIARPAAEPAGQRARGDLHPNAVRREPLDHIVFIFDPGKPLRMGKDGHVSRDENTEEQLLQAGRGDVMRGLGQHVSRIAQRQQVAALKALHELGNDVIVGSGGKFERIPASSSRV